MWHQYAKKMREEGKEKLLKSHWMLYDGGVTTGWKID